MTYSKIEEPVQVSGIIYHDYHNETSAGEISGDIMKSLHGNEHIQMRSSENCWNCT